MRNETPLPDYSQNNTLSIDQVRKAYYSHQVPAPYYDMDEAQYEEELAKFTDYYKELI